MAVILPSAYRDGTTTVVQGGTAVTGQGTLFLKSVLPGDWYTTDDGYFVMIASVNSNTSLTLISGYPGVSRVAGTYSIMLQSDIARMQETSRQLLEALQSGPVYSLSVLPATPNSIYGTDASGQPAILSREVIIPARLASMAQFVTAANALNSISETGWVKVANANVSTVGGPTNGGSGLCFTIVFDANAAVQTYTQVTSATGANKEWIRNKAGGVWTDWTLTVSGDVTNASNLLSGAFRGWNFGDLAASPTLDANNLVGNGLFSAAAGSANTPSATSGWGYILQFQRSSDRKTQIFVDSITAAARIYIRIQLAGGWTAWKEIPSGQSSSTDMTAGAAMLVGAFGLGGTGILINQTSDLNNLPIATASYRWGSAAGTTPANIPSGGSYLMEMVSFGSGGCVQTAYNLSGTNIIWHRKQAGGVWTAWTRIDGDVSGPSSSTTNGIAGFSDTTGKSIKQLSASEGLNSLGPVFGGTAPVPSSAGVGMVDGDFNTVTFPGVYTIAGSWTNGPSGSGSLTYTGILEVQARSFGNLFIHTYRQGTNAWKRSSTNGTAWTAWVVIENQISNDVVTGPTYATGGDYFRILPSDFGNGKPGMFISHPANVLQWNIGLWDGATTAGTLNFSVGSVTHNGVALLNTTSGYTRAQVDNLVTTARQVRLGAIAEFGTTAFVWNEAASGSFIQGVFLDGTWGVRNVRHRTVQQTTLAGAWVTVAQV